jgi:hypothetical protein
LERELERRRGRAPEPGEIFVLLETAELPVEWALLEARAEAFLAIPADVQPLAGSRDFALGSNVLSGPLTLRCGHSVEIAASRLRPELRTGLLDPHSLAAARALQAALAAGTAESDPIGEEVDRDPEYRDWMEDVLDPARAVWVGLGEGSGKQSEFRSGEVVGIEDWRVRRPEKADRRGGPRIAHLVRRASPWLAAALLAVSVGLGWQLVKLQRQSAEPLFDEPSFSVDLATARGEEILELPIGAKWVRLAVAVPDNTETPLVLTLKRAAGEVVAVGPPKQASPGDERSISVARNILSPGLYRLQLLRASDHQVVAERILRFENEDAARTR